MARTLSTALLAAQQATKRKPAIRILINSVDYSSRLLSLEHHEEAYRDYATIMLNNADRGLDSVSTGTTNLLGYRFRIAYGYYTGEIVAEPNGNGAGNEYVDSADLWVKSQHLVSSPGQLVCVLYCEGQWSYAREQRMMALLEEMEVLDPDAVIDDPYFTKIFEGTKTVYELIESVIENALEWTLEAIPVLPEPTIDDGIMVSYKPYYSLEETPTAANILRDLIEMTKCYLRPRANLTWGIIYPQEDDDVDETYYSYQAPYFLEYAEKINLVIPNRIVVFANNPAFLQNPSAPWLEDEIITGVTDEYTGNYTEVLEATTAPLIDNQFDATKRAEAILTRYKAERLAGYLIVYHDARVELYDRVEVVDNRSK